MLFPLCFLSLWVSSSQTICTNMPFLGWSKGWTLEKNGTVLNTLAISSCSWLIVWVFSMWNALGEELTLGHSLPSHLEQHRLPSFLLYSRLFCLTHSIWYSGLRGLPSLGTQEVHCLCSWSSSLSFPKLGSPTQPPAPHTGPLTWSLSFLLFALLTPAKTSSPFA